MDLPRFGIVGSDGATRRWAEALRTRDDLMLAAVSDRDAEELAASLNIAYDDDPRTLLVHQKLDVVVFATSPAAAEKILPVAADHGCAVILDSAAARTFEEGLARLSGFERVKRPVLVRSGWRLDPDFQFLHRSSETLGRVLQIQATLIEPPPSPLGWRGDRVRGGGVLRCAAYDCVDMGIPSDVLGHAVRTQQRWPEPYDAEDTLSVLARYADMRSAVIAAAWRYEPPHFEFYLGGAANSARISESILQSAVGESAALSTVTPRHPHDSYAAIISAMLAALRGEAPAVSRSSLRDHLATLAVIETAYLSAKTGAPEAPLLLYGRYDVPAPR